MYAYWKAYVVRRQAYEVPSSCSYRPFGTALETAINGELRIDMPLTAVYRARYW